MIASATDNHRTAPRARPLFDGYGRIYRGCTAFDAAKYTLQRLDAMGGHLRSHHQR
jgi:hypothetical protein